MLGVLAAAFLLPQVLPRLAAALAVIGLGLVLASNTVEWFVTYVSNPNPDPVIDVGVPSQTVYDEGLKVVYEGMVGGWLAAAAVFGLIITGALYALTASLPARNATHG